MSVFNTGIGKPGLALAIFLAIAMSVLSLIFKPVEILPIQYGICLPSPDSWNFNPFWSWIVNIVLMGLVAGLLALINRSYNFIRTTEPAMPALFLIMTSASPWFTEGLNTSIIHCLCNVVCMGIIFSAYDTCNATQQMFIIGVFAGIGAMFQYAFLPMVFLYFLWSLFMKVMRIKETLAFIAGILCPYWITLGIGWLHFSDFRFPSLTPLFVNTSDHADFLLLLIGIGVAAGIGFIVGLINFMKLYAGNSRVNAMNLCMSSLGAVALICILVDFDNMPAYVATLYMGAAAQMANICALWNPKMPWLVSGVPALIYIAIFVGSVVF